MSDLNAEERKRRQALLSARFGVDPPAARAFDRARRQGFLNDVIAFLRGHQNRLLAFEEVSEKVITGAPVDLGLRQVPLEAIRGSVDRYRDFDLAFLPKHSGMRDRWERVATAREHGLPMPPVELFKLGDIYFVRDGHHRVSVSRSRGDKHIQARVIELTSRVPLHPDLTPADLPLVEAYADFLCITEADTYLPGVDLRLSYPRNYNRLLRHIALFRYLNREPGQEPREWPEAIRAWYEQLYLPILQIVQQRRILDEFADRTPTDLYLWLVTHFRRLYKRLPAPAEITLLWEDIDILSAPFD